MVCILAILTYFHAKLEISQNPSSSVAVSPNNGQWIAKPTSIPTEDGFSWTTVPKTTNIVNEI